MMVRRMRASISSRSELIDVQQLERACSDGFGDRAIGADLREIPDAAQQAVSDARRAPRPAGDLAGAAGVDLHLHYIGRARDDGLEVGCRVVVQSLLDTESGPEG